MKSFVLFVFMLSATICLGQDGWSEWKTSNCYQGIDFRVKKGEYVESAKAFKWIMQIKNKYEESISVSFNLSSAEKEGPFRQQNAISGGITESSFLIEGVENTSEVFGEIKGLKFENSNEFYNCDTKNSPNN